ncbi:MAG: AAA family ATPase [Acidobacteria bacterium]|nr:AAA family ATPase [Acidobacteriota bacterium]
MIYEFCGIRFDPSRNILERDKTEIVLTPKACDLLKLLLDNPDQVLSRDEIYNRLWADTSVSDSALWFQVSRLRDALGPMASLLKTISRRGYVWCTPVGSDTEPTAVAALRSERPSADFPSLIGRRSEVEELLKRLRMAGAGECHLVAISGESGVGKTRVVEELEKQAAARRIPVYHGRFVEGSVGPPYHGLVEAIIESLRLAKYPAGAEATPLTALADPLIQCFPTFSEVGVLRAAAGREATRDSGLGSRTEVFDLLARAFIAVGGGRPQILVFEDIQESEASLDALQYVVRRLAPTPTLVVATIRTDRVAPNHPVYRFLEDFRNDRHFAHIELAPFSRGEHAEFVALLAQGRECGEDLTGRLYEITLGNPLWSREMYMALAERSSAALDSSGGSALLGPSDVAEADLLPATIEQAIERRLQKLSEELRNLLSIASVVGRSFRQQDLRRLLGRGADLEASLTGLIQQGFLREDAGHGERVYSLISPLLASAVYASIPRQRRRELHRRYLRRLEQFPQEQLDSRLTQLLHHSVRSDMPDKIVMYGERLSRASLLRWDADSAIHAARAVLSCVDEVPVRRIERTAEAHLVLGHAHRMRWEWDASLAELRAAIAHFQSCGNENAACSATALACTVAWEGRRLTETEYWLDRGLRRCRASTCTEPLSILLTQGALLANLSGDSAKADAYWKELESIPHPSVPNAPDPSTQSLASPFRMPGARRRLSVPMVSTVSELDPSLLFTVAHGKVLPLVFETLTRPGEETRITPWLAAEFRAEEGGRSFYFRLRENVRFHDGRVVTAQDVRFSFERLLRNGESHSRWLLEPIRGATALMAGARNDLEGFRILSTTEFRVELERPLAFFSAHTAHAATAIVPEGSEFIGRTWRDGVVGTGPYRVARFEPAHSMVLEANPAYWRPGLPRNAGLTFEFDIDSSDALDGFANGRYHVLTDLSPTDLRRLRSKPGLAGRFYAQPGLQTAYMTFNAHRGAFADIGLRRAAVAAVSGGAPVDELLQGLAFPARQLLPPGLLGHDPNAPAWGSTEIMRASGVDIVGIVNPMFEGPYAEFARRLLDRLKVAGFRPRLLECSKAAYYEALDKALVDFVLTWWAADYPDSDNFAYGLLHSTKGIVGRFCGADALDALIMDGRTGESLEKRYEAYRSIEELIRRESLLVPLFYGQRFCFAQTAWEGTRVTYFAPFIAFEEMHASDPPENGSEEQ